VGVALLIALGVVALRRHHHGRPRPSPAAVAGALASRRQLGRGPGFRPLARGPAVVAARSVDGMGCVGAPRIAYAAHVEVFAGGHVVAVPAGIGEAPPLRVDGAYVRGARCGYPLRTTEPTGLILISPGPTRPLADLFALWGQPLGADRLAGFPGRVRGYLDGRLWRGPIGALPLSRHAAISLEVGAFVPPHPRYLFPDGL
jgi:hypothetical protein